MLAPHEKIDFDTAQAEGGFPMLTRQSSKLSVLSQVEGDGEEHREPWPEEHVKRIHDFLNNPKTGKPSWQFWVVMFFQCVQIPHFVIGSFLTPGFMDSFESDSPVFLLFWIFAVSTFMAGCAYALWHARVMGLHVLQHNLSVGKRKLDPKSLKRLRRFHKMLYPGKPLAALVTGAIMGIGVVGAVMGCGVHSHTYNRISAMSFNLWVGTFIPVALAWFYSLCVAVVHCHDAVGLLIKEVSPPEPDKGSDSGSDADPDDARGSGAVLDIPVHTDEGWKERVLDPTQRVATDIIPALSRGWSKVQGTAIVLCVLVSAACLSLSMSPAFWTAINRQLVEDDNNGKRVWYATWIVIGVRIVLYMFVGICAVLSLGSAAGPAAVTTKCQRFGMRLNDIRMSTLTEETDQRLRILERALSKLNRGQGMGYLIGMTVISTETLKAIARGMIAVASVGIPFVLQLEVKQMNSLAPTYCALTTTQQTTIEAVMVDRDDTCIFNQTLKDILQTHVDDD